MLKIKIVIASSNPSTEKVAHLMKEMLEKEARPCKDHPDAINKIKIKTKKEETIEFTFKDPCCADWQDTCNSKINKYAYQLKRKGRL